MLNRFPFPAPLPLVAFRNRKFQTSDPTVDELERLQRKAKQRGGRAEAAFDAYVSALGDLEEADQGGEKIGPYLAEVDFARRCLERLLR